MMETVKAGAALGAGLATVDLGVGDLWLRYFALGGGYSRLNLQRYLSGESDWSMHEHDVVTHALNEYFDERGLDHPMRYAYEL